MAVSLSLIIFTIIKKTMIVLVTEKSLINDRLFPLKKDNSTLSRKRRISMYEGLHVILYSLFIKIWRNQTLKTANTTKSDISILPGVKATSCVESSIEVIMTFSFLSINQITTAFIYLININIDNIMSQNSRTDLKGIISNSRGISNPTELLKKDSIELSIMGLNTICIATNNPKKNRAVSFEAVLLKAIKKDLLSLLASTI